MDATPRMEHDVSLQATPRLDGVALSPLDHEMSAGSSPPRRRCVADAAVQSTPPSHPSSHVARFEAVTQTETPRQLIVEAAATQTDPRAPLSIVSTQTVLVEAMVAATQTGDMEANTPTTAAAATQTQSPPLCVGASAQTDTILSPSAKGESPTAQAAQRRRSELQRKQLESVRRRLAETLLELREVKANARDLETAARVLEDSLATSRQIQHACHTRLLEFEETVAIATGTEPMVTSSPVRDASVNDDLIMSSSSLLHDSIAHGAASLHEPPPSSPPSSQEHF